MMKDTALGHLPAERWSIQLSTTPLAQTRSYRLDRETLGRKTRRMDPALWPCRFFNRKVLDLSFWQFENTFVVDKRRKVLVT